MAAFQVVYDDFSGGQFMGARPANQPKNTWNGTNVIVNANGELIPTGSIICKTFEGVANTTGRLRGHFYSNTTGWLFATYGTQSRILEYRHANGTSFPNPTPSTTISALEAITSNVVYSYLANAFYYGGVTSGTNRLHWRNFSSSTDGTLTWTSGNLEITRVINYKYRLLFTAGVAAPNTSRLYYTSANTGSGYGTTINPSNYYDFNSDIYAVYPRSEDVLVVCADGIYSVTGTFGSSITIQLLATENAVSDGMQDGTMINRTLYFLDTGSALDGRLYRFAGITSQPVASFEFGDYIFNDNGRRVATPAVVRASSNSRLNIAFRNGIIYFESVPGTFAKAQVWTTSENSMMSSMNNPSTYMTALPAVSTTDEYIMTAVMDTTNSSSPITIYRTLTNVAAPTFVDASFDSTYRTTTVKPTGSVELAEYWHPKPFTVKEVFIEYSATTGGSVSCTITPTGVIDVPPASLASVNSTAASETSPPSGGYRMFRYWPNNAAKGMGAKPNLTITNCTVKRVIMNCED